MSDELELLAEEITALRGDLDAALARAEAAEARVAELEAALTDALEVMEFAYMNASKQPKEIIQVRAALQREPSDDK